MSICSAATELSVTIRELGFSTQEKTPQELLEIATAIIQLFKTYHPEKPLMGPLAEQCKEAAKSFEDLPSRVSFNRLFPFQLPGSEISGEEQKKRYEHWMMSQFNAQSCWIPLSDRITPKWTEEQIKQHFQSGFPIYLRLVHKEEHLHKVLDQEEAILPSRVNECADLIYRPQMTQDALYTYRYSMLSQMTRFSDKTHKALAEIQDVQKISHFDALFQHAAKKYAIAMKKDNFTQKKATWLIIGDLLMLHSTCSTNRTPFKGMVGGTKDDPAFIEEMHRIISGFGESKKILVVIDKYGRFIHNRLNFDQKREFLAIGGILQSEIILEMDVSNFKTFIANV